MDLFNSSFICAEPIRSTVTLVDLDLFFSLSICSSFPLAEKYKNVKNFTKYANGITTGLQAPQFLKFVHSVNLCFFITKHKCMGGHGWLTF